ncbi:hypothetical protein HW555_006370 [Spodoptera exigua]|uniref:Uncharacterized protein n=1 Tax=Spodoptera exigua TaxID=7107 RepID=A0A835GGP7_SPOEX|nr:hypothetical protein HW555_006370 [Spodoptera exigua]
MKEARTMAHANSPLVRVLTMLNSLLMSAPECDLFAMRWIDLCRECLRCYERMDDKLRTLTSTLDEILLKRPHYLRCIVQRRTQLVEYVAAAIYLQQKEHLPPTTAPP